MADDTTVRIKFISDINDALQGFQRLNSAAGGFSAQMRNVGESISGVGKGITAGVTLPIVAGLGLATKAAADFDRTMTSVSRSADISNKTFEDGSSKLGEFGKEIKAIAPTIGMMPTDFANLSAEVAKLGVSQDRLLGFTQTVGEVAQIGDLTGQEITDLGQSFAALQTITGMGDKELKNYAASVNKLDDSIGGTMPNIIEFTRQTAASGKLLGIGSKELAAYGSTMQALGIKNGVAYRSMNALMTKLAAPQTLSTTAEEGLQSLGFTVEEMSEIMRKDSEGGIRLFLERLKEIGSQDNQKAIGAVKQLLGGDFGDEILTLALSTNKLNAALEAAGDSTGNLAKYQDELTKKSQSFAGQSAIFSATLQSIGISLGTAILPALNSLLGAITPLAIGFADFASTHPKIVMVGVAISGVVATIGPMIWMIGGAISAWGTLSAAWTVAAPFITGVLVPAIAGIGRAVIALSPVWALAGAAVGLWVYNIQSYARNWDDVWLGMKYTAQSVLSWLLGLWSAGWDAGAGLIRGFVDGMKSHFAWAQSAMSSFTSGIRAYLPFSPAKEGALSDLDKSGGALIQTLVSGINGAAPSLYDSLNSVLGGAIGNATAVPASAGSGGNSSIVVNLSVNLSGGSETGKSESLFEQFRPIAQQVGEEIEKALGKARRGSY